MPRRMSEMLRQRKSENFIGRGEELTILLDALEGIGPPVFHLHGIAGSGNPRSWESSVSGRENGERPLSRSTVGRLSRPSVVFSRR